MKDGRPLAVVVVSLPHATGEASGKLHPNAALTPHQRRRMCRRIARGQSIAGAATDFNASRQTADKWWRRWQDGDQQLSDRSSAPGSTPHRTDPQVEDRVVKLRRRHGWGPDRLASHTGVPSTTCWRIIRRRDCTCPRTRTHVSERSTNSYEAIAPGELVHVDVAKFARIPAGGGHRMLGRRPAGPTPARIPTRAATTSCTPPWTTTPG